MACILIVDDDENHRSLLSDYLQRLGYTTQEARDGQEALDLLNGDMPMAILLDLRMPVMSGWALLDALKKMPTTRSLPVIIISGYGYEWEAELVGANGYVSKPVDLDRVKSTLEEVVGPPPVAMYH
jgi:CheY-like chemotaxis protein